jgi:hypothetical protein
VLAALRCLDALHEQLGQSHEAGRPADVHLSSPELCEDGFDPGERHQLAVTSSMALMRRLLEDAQVGASFYFGVCDLCFLSIQENVVGPKSKGNYPKHIHVLQILLEKT